MRILVTGGAGYIGSHACKRLLGAGHTVVILDNLDRGNRGAAAAVVAMGGGKASFVEGDIADRPLVERTLREHGVDAVMHFAALAYVRESVHEPLRYHRNNTGGTIALLEACDAAGIDRFVFSSTCATYGEPDPALIPIAETCDQRPINPYGWSKLHVERILADYQEHRRLQGRPFAYAALRYFNVAGSDREGVLGEHHEPETHIIPIAIQAALGRRPGMKVFGTDLPTPDGSCVRDYIHVEDLVDAHAVVLEALNPMVQERTRLIYNLAIGRGYSVLEIVEAVRRVTGADFPVEHAPRNPADPPTLLADPAKIRRELGWNAAITDLDEIVRTAWQWMQAHPSGYSNQSKGARQNGNITPT
jgi:UDP-glucose-4-epimerase GalE